MALGADTVARSSSRSTDSPGLSTAISTTLISLNSCLTICSSGEEATSTTIVMRLKASSWVGATARDTML